MGGLENLLETMTGKFFSMSNGVSSLTSIMILAISPAFLNIGHFGQQWDSMSTSLLDSSLFTFLVIEESDWILLMVLFNPRISAISAVALLILQVCFAKIEQWELNLFLVIRCQSNWLSLWVFHKYCLAARPNWTF